MGFDCCSLGLALVRLKTEGLSEEERRLWVERVSDHLQAGKVGELEARYKNTMKVHVLSHDRPASEASVMEKRGYWLE